MSYKPLKIGGNPQSGYVNSMMPRKGVNKEDLTQMMSTDYAIKMVNYIPYRYGIEKRKGLAKVFERAGAVPVTLLKEFYPLVWVFGYGQTVEIYNQNTSTFYTIKNDYQVNDGFDGDRYADYFFVVNNKNYMGRIAMTLNYDAQTANFTVGQKVAGVTSGATAVILADSDSGATGTLTIGNLSGTFINDEIIIDQSTGSATVNGVLGYSYTEVTNAPICGGIRIIGPRAYAYRLWNDGSAVQYSEVDTGSNPPFTSWAITTAADTSGKVNYRNAGDVRSICQLGPITVVFSDNGFYAFSITTTDSAGTLKKIEIIQNYTEDYGGARGAIETPVGIFYNNEAGMWQMVAAGNVDTPMSKNQALVSELLGGEYFKNVDQTNSDLVYDVNQKCVFTTVAKDSPFNNLVIGYKLDLKAMFEFQNWNISRFAKSGEDIYGASSVSTEIYKLFEGYSDDGLPIGTEYYQEMPLKTLFTKHSLSKLYAGGFLSPSSELKIRFDIYNIDGEIEYDKLQYLWEASSSSTDYDEWGSAKWGESAWGGDFDTAGLVESFGGGSPRINNMQRLRVRITGGDKLRHIINWIALKTTRKTDIRRRNISQII